MFLYALAYELISRQAEDKSKKISCFVSDHKECKYIRCKDGYLNRDINSMIPLNYIRFVLYFVYSLRVFFFTHCLKCWQSSSILTDKLLSRHVLQELAEITYSDELANNY